MQLKPEETAVVLIEYQNDFTSDGGALHGAVAEVMDKTGMLGNTAALVEAARAAGATIIHAPIAFAEGYGEITDEPYGILKGVVDSNAFVKGAWGAEIVDALARSQATSSSRASAGSTRSRRRTSTSSCASKGIKTIALGGFLTNCCVESTMRSGYEKGYKVMTLTDCVAATSPEEHDNAIKFDYPMFSEVMSSGSFTEELQGAMAAR